MAKYRWWNKRKRDTWREIQQRIDRDPEQVSAINNANLSTHIVDALRYGLQQMVGEPLNADTINQNIEETLSNAYGRGLIDNYDFNPVTPGEIIRPMPGEIIRPIEISIRPNYSLEYININLELNNG